MPLSVDALARVQTRLNYLTEHGDRLVIDGDVHPTKRGSLPHEIATRIVEDPNYYHGRPLLAEALVPALNLASVDMAMCWQNPAVLEYGDDPDENYCLLLAANEAISELSIAYPMRVIPAGWTDPKALGIAGAKKLARHCVLELAMPVVKMNPAQNAYPIDDPMVFEVLDVIVSLSAVPAFHFGSDSPFTPPKGLEAVAARYADHPVIGVHMGGGGGHFVEAEQTYQEARELGLKSPNIFYVLSAIRDPHIESALLTYAAAGSPWSENLVVGSDAPYGNMIWNFGGFRALFDSFRKGADYGDPRLSAQPDLFNDMLIAKFMGGNLARLVREADARIIAASEPRRGGKAL